jgi:hypothetical protein
MPSATIGKVPMGAVAYSFDAVTQMRRATRRLRDLAWMVGPLTSMPMTDAGQDRHEQTWTTPGGVRVNVTCPSGRELTPDLRESISARIDAEPTAARGASRHVTLQYGSELPLL